MQLKKFIFDKKANAFMHKRLSDGLTFANCLLEKLDILNRGRILTYLPDYVSQDFAEIFEWGGKLIMPETAFKDKRDVFQRDWRSVTGNDPGFITEQLIDSFIKGNIKNFLVLEAAVAEAKSYYNVIEKKNVFFLDNEVYYYADNSNLDNKIINHSLWKSRDWLSIGALGYYSNKNEHFSPHDEVAKKRLESIAENIQYITLEAYDDETHLIWAKDENFEHLSQLVDKILQNPLQKIKRPV